jgi:hypothetical protein
MATPSAITQPQQQQSIPLRFPPGKQSSSSTQAKKTFKKQKQQRTQAHQTPGLIGLKPNSATTMRTTTPLISARQLTGATRHEQTLFLCQLTTQSRLAECKMKKTRERLEQITRERKLRPAEIRELHQLDLRVRMALFAQQLVQSQLVALPQADAPDQLPTLAASREEILERFHLHGVDQDALNRSGPVAERKEDDWSLRAVESPLVSSSTAEDMMFSSSEEEKTTGMLPITDQAASPFPLGYQYGFFEEDDMMPLDPPVSLPTRSAEVDWFAPMDDQTFDDRVLEGVLL